MPVEAGSGRASPLPRGEQEAPENIFLPQELE